MQVHTFMQEKQAPCGCSPGLSQVTFTVVTLKDMKTSLSILIF